MRKSDMKAHWDALFNRIMALPPWMRNILLDDINTAVKNRIAIMEMIEKKVVRKT